MSGGIIGKVSESNNTHLISNTFYAVSTTAGNTATKVAKLVDTSINSITLIEGMLLVVRFAHANTANLPSLKIQSSSGTDLTSGIMIKGVSVDDTWVGTIPIGEWSDNGVVTLLYDGTYWIQTQGHDNDENVRQSVIGDNATYDVLLAGTTGDSTVTTEVYKNNNFNYNPSTNALSVGSISASSTITVGVAPTTDMQVATKKYVDDQMGQAGLGTVTSITAGDGLTTGAAGTSGGTITTTGTIRHTNSATKMTPLDSEYNDALLYPVLLDATGHVRKYKDGINPADFGIVTIDGITGDIINRWARCTSASDAANKTATVQNGTLETLLTGTRVTVSFFYGSDVDNPTLNINSTGAHNIYYNGYQLTELILPAGAAIDFAFDGTNWIVINYNYSSAIDDLWNALPPVTSDYSSTGTDAVNGTAVNKALQTLDSSISATSGQAISAITITDGKISGSSKINVGEANLVTDVQINGTSILSSKVANLITNTAYNSSTNKIATMSDVTDSDKVFVVNVTLTSLTGGTSDKSSTDIYNAARAGKMVIAKVPYNGVQMVAVLVAAARDTSDDIAVFQYQNQKPSGLLSSFGFAKLTIVMNTVVVELAAADAASLGGTYLYSGGSANDGITLAAENGIDINYLSQSPLCNGNVYTLRHTNAVSATTGSAAVYPIKIDAQGHISEYGSAVTIPDDTKVTNTLGTTTKYYVTGTTSSSTNTGTQYFDTGIYSTTTAGQLNATTYKVNEQVTLQWNSTDASLDFIFS